MLLSSIANLKSTIVVWCTKFLLIRILIKTSLLRINNNSNYNSSSNNNIYSSRIWMLTLICSGCFSRISISLINNNKTNIQTTSKCFNKINRNMLIVFTPTYSPFSSKCRSNNKITFRNLLLT